MTGLKDEPVKLWGKISEARLIGISALEELHVQKMFQQLTVNIDSYLPIEVDRAHIKIVIARP
jgi:hypothetical protein